MSYARKLAVPMVKREGGFWDDPAGGPTNFGVTQKTLNYVRKHKKYARNFASDVRNITFENAVTVAIHSYIYPQSLHKISGVLGRVLTDITFMSWDDGARIMQRALNVSVDGAIGPKTIRALNHVPKFLQPALAKFIVNEFLRVRQGSSNYRGWSNRLNGVLNEKVA